MADRMCTYLRHNVLGLVAIFLALTAGAYAVQKAPKNSVVSKSIKDGQVKSADIGDGQVAAADLAAGAVDWNSLQGIPGGLADGTDDNSGGDITGVTAGSGLAGGAANGNAALSLQNCATNSILRANSGTTWACSSNLWGSSDVALSGATPSVAGIELLGLAHGAATVLTDLTNGVAGQRVTLKANSTLVTINDTGGLGNSFQISGNWTPNSGDTLTLIRDESGFWIEVARSAN